MIFFLIWWYPMVLRYLMVQTMRYLIAVEYHKITHSHLNPKHIFTTNSKFCFIFFVSTCCGFLKAFIIPFSIIQSLYISVVTTGMCAPNQFSLWSPKALKIKEVVMNEEGNGVEWCILAISKARWLDENGGKLIRQSKKMNSIKKGFYHILCFYVL